MSLLSKLPNPFARKKKKREVLAGWDDGVDDDDDDDIQPAKKKKESEPEHVILYIRSADHQLWGKTKTGWKLLTHPPKGHVIVMVNLAEENFEIITTPRLFGRDRSSYLARQLNNRFPDTPYRAALDGTPPGKIFEKLAPTKHVLVGLEAEERIKAEIQAHDYSLRGLWTVSIMMAHYGKSVFLPEDLFIVFLGPGGQRIVYLKDRVPILTRLTPNPYDARLQVDEIIRTLRYLENKQIVGRGNKRHSLLLLADPTGLAEPLAQARIDLVGQERWKEKPPEDWRFPLFDLVVKHPAGQLAPLSQRTLYLADRINHYAKNTRLAIIILTVLLIASLLPSTTEKFEQRENAELQISGVTAKIAETNRKIGEYGATPEMLRRTLELNEKELASSTAPAEHFPLLAGIVSLDPNIRLTKLKWRLVPATATPCPKTDGGTANPAAMPDPNADPDADPNAAARKTELSFEANLPEIYGPRERVRTLQRITTELTKIKGSAVLIDPLKAETQGALSGGDRVVTDKAFGWCLTLPGVLPPPAPAAPTEPVAPNQSEPKP